MTTDPVGVPLVAETPTVTARLCVAVIVMDAGVTVTLGVVAALPCVTVTEALPEALLYVELLALSGVYLAVSVSDPAAREPAGMVIVAEPELNEAEAEA